MNNLKLAVCICTYNRAESLARTLESIAAQVDVDWVCIEIIIVDNNCTDATPALVEAWASKIPIRRVLETKQGLSHARNRAVAEARQEWILFTDDDVVLDPLWLPAYLEAFDRFPNAAFAGGRVVPLWPGEPPSWFNGQRLELLDGVLVWYELSLETRLLADHDPLPFGASFALRRTLIEQIGGFRADLGVSGAEIGRGEETEFMMRARATGHNGIYVGKALCHHIVNPSRLQILALYRYGVASGKAHKAIKDSKQLGSPIKAAEFLARGMFQLCKGRGDRFRQCVINAGIQAGLR